MSDNISFLQEPPFPLKLDVICVSPLIQFRPERIVNFFVTVVKRRDFLVKLEHVSCRYIVFRVRVNYATTPPPAKIYSPPSTTTHHQPKYIHHHANNGPPPSKSQNIFIYNFHLTLF